MRREKRENQLRISVRITTINMMLGVKGQFKE